MFEGFCCRQVVSNQFAKKWLYDNLILGMKRSIIGIIIVAVLAVGAVTAWVSYGNRMNTTPSNTNDGEPALKDASYDKEGFSLSFSYPGDLSVDEISPTEPIKEANIDFHNQRPDFEVRANSQSGDDVYVIALYKKTLRPSSMLGNYLAMMTSDNGGPGQVIDERQELISGISYKILESSPGKNSSKKIIESAGNTVNGWTVYLLGVSSDNNSSSNGTKSILESLRISESAAQNYDWKKICRDDQNGVSLLVPSVFVCYSGSARDVYFDVIGKYPSESKDPMQVNYRINFLKNIDDINLLLDAKYSCDEGPCLDYPVSLSTVKINDSLFKISQSDDPSGPDIKTGMIVPRSIKAAGKIDEWAVGVFLTGVEHKRGIELPADDQILSDLRDIIGTIKVSQK
jgi:hypothetical protein